MNNLFVIIYNNDPKNFDVLRLVNKGTITETEVLATSDEKSDYQSMPTKKFFTPAVWKRARLVADKQELLPYKKASQSTAEFKAMVKGLKPVK